jgi:hypothetical protein
MLQDIGIVVRTTSRCLFHAGLLFSLFFNPEDGRDIPSKIWLTFIGQHGIVYSSYILQIIYLSIYDKYKGPVWAYLAVLLS